MLLHIIDEQKIVPGAVHFPEVQRYHLTYNLYMCCIIVVWRAEEYRISCEKLCKKCGHDNGEKIFTGMKKVLDILRRICYS